MCIRDRYMGKRREEEDRQRKREEDERRRREEDARKEAKKREEEEERQRKEAERRQKEDQRRREEEDEKRRKEEKKRQEEDEKRQKEEERRRKEEDDRRRKEEERRREDEDRRRREEEEQRRKEEERQREENERRRKELLREQELQEQRQREMAKKQEEEEKRRKEQEQRSRGGSGGGRNVGGAGLMDSNVLEELVSGNSALAKGSQGKKPHNYFNDDEFEDVDLPDESLGHSGLKPGKQPAAAKPGPAGKKPVDLGDLADELEDIDDSYQPVQTGSKGKPGQQKQQADEAFDDEFDESGGMKLPPPELIVVRKKMEAVHDYMNKADIFASSADLASLGSYDAMIYVFQEMILTSMMYVFDYNVGEALLQLFMAFKELQDEKGAEAAFEEVTPDLEALAGNLREEYLGTSRQPEPSPAASYFVPFSPDNPFHFILLELNCQAGVCVYYYLEDPPDEELQENLNVFNDFVSNIFEAMIGVQSSELPALNNYQIDANSLKVLKTLDNPYIVTTMILMNIYHEPQDDPSAMLNLEERAISLSFDHKERGLVSWTSLADLLSKLETDLDAIVSHFANEKKKAKGITSEMVAIRDVSDFEGVATIVSTNIRKLVTTANKGQQVLAAIDLPLEEQKLAYYVSMKKAANGQLEVSIFYLSLYEPEISNIICESVAQGLPANTKLLRFYDYPRHNMTYEYAELSLSVWTVLVGANKLTPRDAMLVMTYFVAPYVPNSL
eukprot:TRINITY_DN1767_c0_g1_i3.p1 TRINITY_DN1767_c0_g1~~TRINITY_DN1767_c0_g1_i3.p1  ORF type:complete len:730 (-),score=229.58 TRINITY_DN1767_c0_g1_i3:105-2294(-)